MKAVLPTKPDFMGFLKRKKFHKLFTKVIFTRKMIEAILRKFVAIS
jgi:hypothetical protein